jgi:predicted RNA-binding Zn-ribbon protein involved in translation (DUF1610 family)
MLQYIHKIRCCTIEVMIMAEDQVECPKCGSTQITANKKGFSLGNAAVGGFLLGPVGLLGGLAGSNKVKVTCLKCGHSWDAGNPK